MVLAFVFFWLFRFRVYVCFSVVGVGLSVLKVLFKVYYCLVERGRSVNVIFTGFGV